MRLNFTIMDIEYVFYSTDKNLVFKGHVLSREKNGDDLKTYIYRQSTISPKVLKTKPKNRQNIRASQVLSLEQKTDNCTTLSSELNESIILRSKT